MEGGGVFPNPPPCSGLWRQFFTPARWNGLENGSGVPSGVIRLVGLCPLGAAALYHSTPPHVQSVLSTLRLPTPREIIGEREISCPLVMLEFAPLMDPLRPFAAI